MPPALTKHAGHMWASYASIDVLIRPRVHRMGHPAQSACMSVILGSVSDKAFGLGAACLSLCGSSPLIMCNCRTSVGISTRSWADVRCLALPLAHARVPIAAAPRLSSAATACNRGGRTTLASLNRRAQSGLKHLGQSMSQPSQGYLASEFSLTVGLSREEYPCCRICRLDHRAQAGAAPPPAGASFLPAPRLCTSPSS